MLSSSTMKAIVPNVVLANVRSRPELPLGLPGYGSTWGSNGP